MSVSFGVEFEFDLIDQNNRRIVGSGRTPYYLANNWGYQPDPTATMELRSPVFTSLEQYIEECNKQFSNMLEARSDIVPYMCNSSDRSLGQHMHIGKPNLRLTERTRKKIARKIINFYPLLTAIHAQPIPSRRGLTSPYCRSMEYYNDFADHDHYAELSLSHNGTLELRIFDSNIPQASLVCAFLAREIAKKSMRRGGNSNEDYSTIRDYLRNYRSERSRALRYGLLGVDITQKLRELKRLLGNIEIPEIASIKEALYLMARYRLNFYGVLEFTHVKHYEYFKLTLRDCSKYLEHLLEARSVRHRDKIATWIAEAQQIENLDQLIGLSIGVDRAIAERLTQAVVERLEQNPELARRLETCRRIGIGRSRVRELIERGNYFITRIDGVTGYSRDEVAEEISNLIRLHGESMVNNLTPREIIESPVRYYVFYVRDSERRATQICGVIGLYVREGEISSLVVNRAYRRLGIAKRLITSAIAVLINNHTPVASTWIRKDNEASLRLFRSFGFRIVENNHRSYRLELKLERD